MADYRNIVEEIAREGKDPAKTGVKQPSKYSNTIRDLYEEVSPETDRFFYHDEFNTDYLPKDYAFYESEFENPEEIRAQLQPFSHKLASFGGRVLTTTLGEFAKGFGYLGGLAGSAFTGEVETVTNNFFVEAINDIQEGLKEAMPVYAREAITSGNLLQKLTNVDFWGNQGADAIGFVLSSIGYGGVFNKLGKMAKVGSGTNFAVTTASQSFIEAAAEASNLNRSLRQYWDERKMPNGMYRNPQEGKAPLSEEEVNDSIGSASVESLVTNFSLLLAPNALMTRNIFGSGNQVKNVFKGIDVSSTEAMKTAVAKLTPWKRGMKGVLKEGPLSGLSEGFQELSQFVIEDYQTKKSKGLANPDLTDAIYESFTEGITSAEGQESMALGFLLGLGPGSVKAYKDARARATQAKGLSELLDSSTTNFKEQLQSIYKKDAQGDLIIKDGKYEIDTEKAVEILKSVADDQISNAYYQLGKFNKQPHQSKLALADMVVKYVSPYFETEGGSQIFEQHLQEASETFEQEATALGFENKQQYVNFIKGIAATAKTERAKIKKKGPAYFGIKKSHLISATKSKKNINEMYDTFIANVENAAMHVATKKDIAVKNLEEVNKEIAELEKESQPIEGETAEQTTQRNVAVNAQLKTLKKQQEAAKRDVDALNKQYSSFFDKVEMQKAFNNMVRNIEELQEAAEQDKAKDVEDKDFQKEFYSNLKEKGFNVEASDLESGETNDLRKGKVKLKDKNNNVFQIVRNPDKAKEGAYNLVNVKTGESVPLTPDALKEKGLDKLENILSEQEFEEWLRIENIQEANNKKLEIIESISGKNDTKFKNETQNLIKLQEKLAKYQEELKGWNELDPNLTVESILEEIIRLEEMIESVNQEIEKVENTLTDIKNFKDLINSLRFKIQEAKSKNAIFDFNSELIKINKEIEENNLEEDVEVLNRAIERGEYIVNHLNKIKDSLQQSLTQLYKTIVQHEQLEDIIGSLGKSTKFRLVQEQLKKLNRTKVLGMKAEDLTADDVRELLNNDLTRKETLEILAQDKENVWQMYDLKVGQFKTASANLTKAQKSLDRLLYNKELINSRKELDKYINFFNDKYEIEARKAADETIGTEQDKTLPGSPVEQVDSSDSKVARKSTPFSTIINQKNEQGRRWSHAMSKIPINKLNEYSLRFVNNKILKEELGVTPPSDKDNDIYAVVYHWDKPLSESDGLVYAGIANTDTYFTSGNYKIDLRRNSDWIKANKLLLEEDKQFKFTDKNGNVYTDIRDLEDGLQLDLATRYKDWRTEITTALSRGLNAYTDILDVSKGIPQLDLNQKSKPEAVFGKFDNIQVPNKDIITKVSKHVQDAAPGMPHGTRTDNKQVVRLLNNKVESKEQLDTILKFLALPYFIQGNSMKREFFYEGTEDKMPLVGYKNKTGILDLFINTGKTEDKFSIFIDKIKGDAVIVVNNKDKVTRFRVKDLFDGKPDYNNIRESNDPVVKEIVDFLKTKYMNVARGPLSSKNPFKLPTGWKFVKGGDIEIEFENTNKPYTDYVLNNVLYTNVEKNTAEKPNFVNQYISFTDDSNRYRNEPKKKNQPKIKTLTVEEANNQSKQEPVKKGLLSNASKTSNVVKVSEGSVLKKGGLLSKAMQKAREEEKNTEEKCDTPGAKVKAPTKVKGVKKSLLKKKK